MDGDAEVTTVAVGVGVGTGLGLGEPHRLSAITRTKRTKTPAAMAIVRGEIGNSRATAGGETGWTTGVFLSGNGSGSDEAATIEFTVPQSGQAGRFTGS